MARQRKKGGEWTWEGASDGRSGKQGKSARARDSERKRHWGQLDRETAGETIARLRQWQTNGAEGPFFCWQTTHNSAHTRGKIPLNSGTSKQWPLQPCPSHPTYHPTKSSTDKNATGGCWFMSDYGSKTTLIQLSLRTTPKRNLLQNPFRCDNMRLVGEERDDSLEGLGDGSVETPFLDIVILSKHDIFYGDVLPLCVQLCFLKSFWSLVSLSLSLSILVFRFCLLKFSASASVCLSVALSLSVCVCVSLSLST